MVLREGLSHPGRDGWISAEARPPWTPWTSSAPQDVERLAALPFDYERRLASVLVQEDGERRIIVKGAPEEVLARCTVVAPQARAELDRLFAQGSRVVAVDT